MEPTKATKNAMNTLDQQFKRKSITTPLVTLALIGIALVGADRYGLSLPKQIIAAGVPAWGGTLFFAYTVGKRDAQLETKRAV